MVAGASVGVVFDFYRTFRRWQGWGRVITFIGDLFFSLVALYILFRFFEKANALAFRAYIMWGSLLGLVIYLRLLSRFSVRCFFGIYRILAYLTRLIHRGIKIPIRALVLIMRPPYAILRWFSVLLFRIGEVILIEPCLSVKKRIKAWVKGLIPPKTNG
nr:spore cortex biosynthesis protein YabQ [Desulfosporosinus sp. I2]